MGKYVGLIFPLEKNHFDFIDYLYCVHMNEDEYKKQYKSLVPCYCPALKETVYFNQDGFHHLLFKNRRERSTDEKLYRLSLLPYIHEIIEKSATAKLRIKSENPLVKTWAISHRIIKEDGIQCTAKVVVIRKKPNGRLYFLSVMDR